MQSSSPLPQLTVKAIILGLILSAVLAGANSYLGLFAGLTVSASIPAAVISMAILRMFKESNILENNIVQTAASAGESVAAGVIFTLPALILMGYWPEFKYWWVVGIAGLGGLLGVLFTIPLRRALIVEEGLAFPEGKATAEVLKVGDDPSTGVKYLAWAAIAGGLTKLSETGFKLWDGTAQTATYLGKSTIVYLGTNLSPALLSVGYIVGLNIAVLVFVGGAISWYVAIPIYSTLLLDADPNLGPMFAADTDAVALANAIWSQKVRYLGVGAMLIGGVWALISTRKSLISGIKSGMAQYGGDAAPVTDHRDMDTPMNIVLIAIAVFVVPIFLLYWNIVDSLGIALIMTLLMVVTGFLFSSVAAYMAGLVGSSNNPISGITIATILFASLLLSALMGQEGASLGPAAAIMIGGVVCSAAAIAGDNMQDLKAGYIVGATPWRQQVMQGVGVISAVLVMAPVLNLLNQAYGIGPGGELQAPQATLMQAVAEGVFRGGLPWEMVWIGIGIGVVIIAVDEYLRHKGAKWRAPVLAVAVGIYLPLELSVPIFFGGIIAHLAERYNDRYCTPEQKERNMRHGMLFAAGLITGEALIGIFMAIPIVATGEKDVLKLPVELPYSAIVGLAIVGALAYALYRLSSAREKS